MTPNTTPKTSRRFRAARLLSGLVALAGLCLTAAAQDLSQYDRGTPPQHAAGVSALGSYVSADLGTINLSNGSLNFRLPLGAVGGRGFWLPLTLNYSSKVWSGRRGQVFVIDPPPGHNEPTAYAYYNDGTEDSYNVVAPGWTVGAAPFLKARGVGITPNQNINGCTDYAWVVVKLTLVLPDKGEIELRDNVRDGAPHQPGPDSGGCKVLDSGVGRFWHSTDGSGIFFINDNSDGVLSGDLGGTVIMADGTRYHFINTAGNHPQPSAYVNSIGRCDWVRDRNGNKLVINYPTNTRVEYLDQLGRITTVESNVNDPQAPFGPLALLVTLPGYNGQVHYYKVKTAIMNQNYRSDIHPALPVQVGGEPNGGTILFPGGFTGVTTTIDSTSVLTQLILPDGRALAFKYNEFGEVAEVQMPTAGKVWYDYASTINVGMALPSGNSLTIEVQVPPGSVGNGNVRAVDRAVTARRTYPDGNTSPPPEGSWSYSYQSTKTQVLCSAGATTLLNEWHYFMQAQRFLTGTLSKGPDGTGYSLWSTGVESRSELLNASGSSVIAASEHDWSQRKTIQQDGKWTSGFSVQEIANDNRVVEERKILDDPSSYSRVDTFYDQSLGDNHHINNPVQVDEYDLDLTTLKRETKTAYNTTGNFAGPGVNNLNILTLVADQWVYDGSDLVNAKAHTSYEYDNYTNDNNNQPLATYTDFSSIPGHDPTFDPFKMTRANATKVTKMVDASTSITSYTRYDVLGNVVSIKDPKTNESSIGYLDDFGDGSNPGLNTGGQSTYALPTKITSPAPNLGESPQTAYSQYDFKTGLLTGFKDRNGVITQTFYNDSFDRPTQIKVALGTTLENHTAMYYAPQTNPFVTLTSNDVLTAKDQASINDGHILSWNHTDGFGRTIQGFSHDLQGDIQVATTYDGMGRVKRSTNPYRNTGESTYGYADTVYDLAGRVTSVTTSDGAVVMTSYLSNSTTVTDQAARQRRSITDGLGRLIRVDEPDPATGSLGTVASPTQPTSYLYDVLDDLTTVTQGTQPSRSFVYDSLKRLTDATNPESGHVHYTYDASSNLATKLDARSIMTTYTYDALNRVKKRIYSDSTPEADYYYDGQQLPNTKPPNFTATYVTGRLIAACYGGATSSAGNYQSYDQLGRVNVSYQQTDSTNYGFGYGYNLASEMTSETYPSGRQVITEYDAAGREAGVSAGGFYYAGATASDATNRIQYAAHGAVSVMALGNGKWEHTNFNSRLQPTQIGLGTSGTDSSILKLDYGYGATTNNGNVTSQTITAPKAGGGNLVLNQTYTYDWLNRLLSASENGSPSWVQNYDYDRYGNRAVNPSSTLIPNPALTPTSLSNFSTATNRITLTGFAYDVAGNMKNDPTTTPNPPNGMVYDGENRQISYTKAGAATSYAYNGDGHRVKKIAGSVTTVFVYNASGELTAEYTNDTTPPVGGGGTSYLTSDHLGSTRVVMKSDGTTVKARYDYLPFGEEIPSNIGSRGGVTGYSGVDSTKQKFTQKERDSESGLDYFLARYYSSAQGRFTSPDPIMMKKARLIDPQRLNLYVYARCNPLKYVDPNGADIMLAKDLNQKGHEKDRKYVVDNLARLYMTEKGRAYLERADKSQFNIEIGKGKLERHMIGGEKPGTTTIGGSEHVTGGLTTAKTATDPGTGTTTLMASGPAIVKEQNFPPITVTIDKDNAADMGKDPASVFAHEIGGHVAGILNFAERPSADNPANPSFDLTGRDLKQEETAAQKAEGVGKLPGKPSQEAIKAVEELLKKRE
jgi:RHS repeat-associated protein